MRQQVERTIQACTAAPGHSIAEMLGVPIDDDGGEQVQPGHAEVLSFGRSVTDFTLAADTQGIFQGMMGLAFVNANLGVERRAIRTPLQG